MNQSLFLPNIYCYFLADLGVIVLVVFFGLSGGGASSVETVSFAWAVSTCAVAVRGDRKMRLTSCSGRRPVAACLRSHLYGPLKPTRLDSGCLARVILQKSSIVSQGKVCNLWFEH